MNLVGHVRRMKNAAVSYRLRPYEYEDNSSSYEIIKCIYNSYLVSYFRESLYFVCQKIHDTERWHHFF